MTTSKKSKWSWKSWKKAMKEVGDLMRFVSGFLRLKGLLVPILMGLGSPPGDAPASFIEELAPAYEFVESTSHEGHQVAAAPPQDAAEGTCVANVTSN